MAKTILKRVNEGEFYIVREENGKFYFVDGYEPKQGKMHVHETDDVSRAYRFTETDALVFKETLARVQNNEQYTVKKIHTEFAYVMD